MDAFIVYPTIFGESCQTVQMWYFGAPLFVIGALDAARTMWLESWAIH